MWPLNLLVLRMFTVTVWLQKNAFFVKFVIQHIYWTIWEYFDFDYI